MWGPVFTQDVNGDKVPERKPDGVHVCPSGAAMYAIWLMNELQQRFTDFVPVPPALWATGEWVGDPRVHQPGRDLRGAAVTLSVAGSGVAGQQGPAAAAVT